MQVDEFKICYYIEFMMLGHLYHYGESLIYEKLEYKVDYFVKEQCHDIIQRRRIEVDGNIKYLFKGRVGLPDDISKDDNDEIKKYIDNIMTEYHEERRPYISPSRIEYPREVINGVVVNSIGLELEISRLDMLS
nr:hypothetical protein [uncultured Mediterraneibacter sp.]